MGLGLATAALWVVNPTLVAVAQGRGDWVGLNFLYCSGAGSLLGEGGGYKKALDRIIANSVAIIFVMVVVDLGGVNDVGTIIGIMMPWIFVVIMQRTPENAYRWTCMGFVLPQFEPPCSLTCAEIAVGHWKFCRYTFGLATFELSSIGGPVISSYFSIRLTLIATGIFWWIGFEILFGLLLQATGSYQSNSSVLWR